MKELELLRKIPEYGRCLYNGQHYNIKFCRKATQELRQKLQTLKAKYPELVVYYAKTGRVLFGGTFHTNSQFLADKERVLGK